MKKRLIILLMLSNYCLVGQVINGDFESWRTLPTSPTSEDPVGWTSNNPGIIHHYGVNAVEKSNDSYSGSYAVQINQFYDSTSTCNNNFLVYKELAFDTSLYGNNCPARTIDVNTDYDTLSYMPYKLSFYYKTVNLKPSSFNWFEINIIDTTDPFGLPSGAGSYSFPLTPTSTYIKKEVIIKDIKLIDIQLITYYINIRNSFDSSYKNGYVLIDNVHFEGISDVNEIDYNQQISVYPNPATNNLSINSNEFKINKISIFDMYGKQIKTLDCNSHNEDINISFLPKGVYIFRILTNKKITTKRVVRN